VREYERGFEDAVELALDRVRHAESLEEAEEELRYILALVKEKKFEKLRRMVEAPLY